MHTWQSEAILGFFLVANKRLVKLLVFSPELLWGRAALNFFVHIIMILLAPTLPPMLEFCLVNCLVYWYVID